MHWGRVIVIAAGLGLALNCGGKPKVQLPPPLPARVGFVETGVASWYGHPYHGRKTSNGETYDMDELTAAHLQLPFGTVVRVTNLANDQSVEVRINDRGPFVKQRIIDLSRAAARRIDMIRSGTARVKVEVVNAPERAAISPPLPAGATAPGARCGSRPYYGAQVGSFEDIDNAQRMRGKMLQAYGEARIYAAEADNGQLVYRVIVGSAESIAGLRRLIGNLAADGIDSFVRRLEAADADYCT